MHGSSQGTPVPLTTWGGLVTLAGPDSLPEGASPRCYDVDFLVGSAHTRDGLRSVYTYDPAGEPVGPNGGNSASSATWTNPNGILHLDTSFASSSAFPSSGTLDVTEFSFDLPSTTYVQGFRVTISGYANTTTSVNVQLLQNGIPIGTPKSIELPLSQANVILGSLTDLWGASFVYSDVNNTAFGIRITASSGFSLAQAFLDNATIEVGTATADANFTFITTFVTQDGDVKNISLDANGNLWVEDVTNNPGVLDLALGDVTPNSYAVGVQGEGTEYLAFNNGFTGSDIPRQYTPQWIDRITQVGPGASPVFTPGQATSNTFAISTITQYPPNSDITDPGHISVMLQSTGPGSTSPGNVITVYYSPSFYGGSPHPEAEDMTLVNAFNSGVPVYVYISGTSIAAANGTFLVTSVGNALPPGVDHFRYYFTVQTTSSAYQKFVEDPGQYQMTVATMTMAVPVPGLTVGNIVTISGTSASAYNTTWPISQTINSGAMAITNTVVSGGVATYSYSVASGANPVAGELVTVTGTNNADGLLNVVNATIASSTGGSTGTFTISLGVPDAASSPESGQATTAGTIFAFDPGLTTLGTSTNPIYGSSIGGTLTFTGASAQLIGPGTRQGTVFFITRNGYYTAPGPPVTFTCPDNTTSIIASQIPLGPPNVIARGIAFTEAGQNGVPGANFFTLQTPVQYIVQNVKYTATSLVIQDNTSTNASFFFTDSVLLNAQAIDVYGYNLFNQIEIGNPGWITAYSDRNFYGLCQNKLQNFNNMSFDGGFLPAGQTIPLGWSSPDLYGSLLVSPIFGNSYYIRNTSTGTLGVAGLISQTAFQDAYQQPILSPNTAYSVRVTARIPSGLTTGNLVVSLVGSGITYGTFSIPFANLTASMAIYTGTLLTTDFLTVPAELLLNLSATNIGVNADVEIDRIEVFPTKIPILATTVYGSYAGLPEQVDGVTGQGKFTSQNQQPVNGGVVMYDTFYGLKGIGPSASMYSWQQSPNLEPADWDIPEVAQRSGACGPMAFDFGEQWIVMACRNGVYLYEGGQPGKISQEIFQVWDAINWKYAETIWVKNDVTNRRLFIGVPMPTPNFWLPDAPVSNPTSPNVILMLNYQGMDTGKEIQMMPGMHVTMFGSLNAIDMRRKWTLWRIPSPYGNFVQAQNDKAFYLCNGRGNSKVYKLDPTMTTDDGIAIDSVYTTAGLGSPSKMKEQPELGYGNKRIGYGSLRATGTENLAVRLLPDTLLGPTDSTVGYNAWTVPGGFNLKPNCLRDLRFTANFFANRTFVEFRGADFDASILTLWVRKDAWSAPWGPK